MHLDLKKIPFGKRLSRHLLYEETDNLNAGWAKGLHLALAAESSSGFIGGPMAGPKGFALITPTYEYKDIEYKCAATPSAVELKTGKGGAGFVIDGTKVLRIKGSGIGLRINGRLGFGGTGIMTKRGIELTMGGSICLITSLKGKMSLDCHWDLKGLRSTDPIITIEPESGNIDLVIYDTDDTYELPALTDSIDQCIKKSEADFKAFVKGLKKPSIIGSALYDYYAYALWTGFQSFKGKELAPSNIISDMNIYSIEQPIAALAFKDAEHAVGIITDTLNFATPQGMVPTWFAGRQNLNEAVPPVYGFAVNRLIDDGKFKNVTREKLSALYDAMSKTATWWLKKRSNDKGMVYYAYRHECNWPKEKIFGAGTPCCTPDLAAYIALAAESLSKVAEKLGKSNEKTSWDDISKKQIDILTNTLWGKNGFVSINARTGELAACEGMLSLIPLILGRRLPVEIINVLAEKTGSISFEDIPVIPAVMIIHGLKESGKDAEAVKAASALVKSCGEAGANNMRGKNTRRKITAGAFFSPAACAALLSLGDLQ